MFLEYQNSILEWFLNWKIMWHWRLEQWRENIYFRIRMSFIARYVYTYKEFVFVTEDTSVQQNDSDQKKKKKKST